jgi:hypothetical protein
VAGITAVEVASAIARRLRGGTLSQAQATAALAQFRQDLTNEYFILDITRTLLDKAALLAVAHALRAYDAVQLATVAEVHSNRMRGGAPPVTLVSADLPLNAAAVAMGILIDDPNTHP